MCRHNHNVLICHLLLRHQFLKEFRCLIVGYMTMFVIKEKDLNVTILQMYYSNIGIMFSVMILKVLNVQNLLNISGIEKTQTKVNMLLLWTL